MPELGPFNEPPFYVLSRLAEREWLALQPQWYFLAAIRNKSRDKTRRLQALIEPGKSYRYVLEMAPTDHQKREGLVRLMAQESLEDCEWRVSANGVPLVSSPFVRKPLDHAYEGYLGQPVQYACFFVPTFRGARGAQRNTPRTDSGPESSAHLPGRGAP